MKYIYVILVLLISLSVNSQHFINITDSTDLGTGYGYKNLYFKWIDIDSDNDLDFYNISYSFYEANPALYQGMYINQGNGKFIKQQNSKYDTISVLHFSDYNHDGNMDYYYLQYDSNMTYLFNSSSSDTLIRDPYLYGLIIENFN